ncbi:MAG TPA: hypothetical protein VGS10_04915 [Terracidiphilus sp.]|nr:hypothetical protein [Terracidiphilus sp.]
MKTKWNMKTIASAALMLSLGVAAVYAQEVPLNMTLSGTGAPSTINLQTGTGSSEYSLAGKGTLGRFTLRVVSAGAASPQPSSTCSGLYFPVLAGEGVFRFQDGSLMKLDLTEGFDCIDLATQQAHCVRIFQITGGTGRFKDASGGKVALSMTVAPVVPNIFDFFTVTADITGTVSGIDEDRDQGEGQ